MISHIYLIALTFRTLPPIQVRIGFHRLKPAQYPRLQMESLIFSSRKHVLFYILAMSFDVCHKA